MFSNKIRQSLEKQHYSIAGNHSAVQICRWAKKSLTDEGFCYKQKFYGIESHLCCQMSPSVVWCPNKCLHCWRAIELTLGDKLETADSPKEIIKKSIEAQRKLIIGFKGNKKINMKKWEDAQNPRHFAISLSGEPMLYKKIGELIAELRKQKKTSFLVTNGLYPEKLKQLIKKKQLPTQLYISVNTPNKELYDKFHRSSMKNAWDKLNQSLELMSKINGRTVVRINLVKNLNMNDEMIEDYAKLIQKAKPMFIEIKGYMAVGYARQRLGYDRMPWHKDIKDFSKKLLKFLKKVGYKFLDEKTESRVILIGKSKKDMKIQKI